MTGKAILRSFILLIGAASAAAGTVGAEEHLSGALVDCRAINDEVERLACYDQLADVYREVEWKEEPSSVLAVAPSAPPAVVATESDFGRSKEVTNPPDSIVGDIDEIDRTAYGKLILRLENGQVWQQLDSRRMTLREGDEVRISRAMSGSFLLQKASGGTSIRVRRIDT